jgi:hypothetical protein
MWRLCLSLHTFHLRKCLNLHQKLLGEFNFGSYPSNNDPYFTWSSNLKLYDFFLPKESGRGKKKKSLDVLNA